MSTCRREDEYSFDPKETIQINNYAYKKVVLLSVGIHYFKTSVYFYMRFAFPQRHNCFPLLRLSANPLRINI